MGEHAEALWIHVAAPDPSWKSPGYLLYLIREVYLGEIGENGEAS